MTHRQRDSLGRDPARGRTRNLFEDDLEQLPAKFPRRLNSDPETLEKGLAQLVMTVIELLRQLMERQALRRIDAGTVTDDEVERLGRTFLALSERMEELKREFGLSDQDLNMNLGPLGDLM